MTCLPGERAAAYTRELARKHPGMVLAVLEKSGNPLHGDLVAELLGATLDKLFKEKGPNWDNRVWNDMLDILPAVLGKDSPGMLALYRELAAWYAGHFERWKASGGQFQNLRKIPLLDPFLGRDGKWPLPAGLLAASIWRNPSPALRALAEELAERYGWAYGQPLVLAVGLTEPPAAVFDRFAPMLEEDRCTRNQRLGVLSGLGLLTGRGLRRCLPGEPGENPAPAGGQRGLHDGVPALPGLDGLEGDVPGPGPGLRGAYFAPGPGAVVQGVHRGPHDQCGEGRRAGVVPGRGPGPAVQGLCHLVRGTDTAGDRSFEKPIMTGGN